MSRLRVSKWVRLDATRIPIIATVGPRVFDPQTDLNRLPELLDNGVAAFRINFSHVNVPNHGYSYDDVRSLITAIRKLEDERDVPIPIIMDLKGPEIRVSRLLLGNDEPSGLPLDIGVSVLLYQ